MKQNRREFLKKSGCAALTMTALATQFEHFGRMSAMAQTKSGGEDNPPTDYRALVCIFLMGGNDANNMVIPNHNDANVSNYSAYSAARAPQGLALAQNSLLPITVPRVGALTYGLHPALGTVTGQPNNGLHELWASGKMAIVTNVGTLIRPMTRAQYQNGSVQRPMQLFSHSDQIAQHQTARSDSVVLSGWGGRISDKLSASANPLRLIPTITSISGAQLYTVGENTQPVAMGPAPTPLSNVLALSGYNGTPIANARLASLNQGFDLDASYELIQAANQINKQAIQISRSLENSSEVTTPFPNTELGNQLKQIARLIKNRTPLNMNRQIFFCTLGGFDTHTSQLIGQAALLTQVSQAMRAFYEEMIVQNLQNQVTQFTLSDFNRTFNPGGSGGNVGSDHAWASHSFVVGGSVIGGDFYGVNTTNGTPFPTLVQNGPDDADNGSGSRGRWIPTTSVEQYAATLATWFGLPENDMPYVLPNLQYHTIRNLGFMAP